MYVSRQASRRSWRIGQTRPVKVVFMPYKNTLLADALKLVAKKMQSSLAVEDELPEDGLAAYGDDGDDLMMALARKIVNGDQEDEAETIEDVLTQARNAEATAEELLVDDGWKLVEVEPVAVAVNRNGQHAEAHEVCIAFGTELAIWGCYLPWLEGRQLLGYGPSYRGFEYIEGVAIIAMAAAVLVLLLLYIWRDQTKVMLLIMVLSLGILATGLVWWTSIGSWITEMEAPHAHIIDGGPNYQKWVGIGMIVYLASPILLNGIAPSKAGLPRVPTGGHVAIPIPTQHGQGLLTERGIYSTQACVTPRL